MQEERLLKLTEVSARLALSRTAIYRLMATGELKPLKIGGALRFPASAIDRLIEALNGEALNGEALNGEALKEEVHAKAA